MLTNCKVLWIFKEWKRQRLEECNLQQAPINPVLMGNHESLKGGLSFVDNIELNPGFWETFGFESEMVL